MEQLIQNIQDRLIEKVEALKYVDQDWGQMDFYERPPVKYPCALIDIQSVMYSDSGSFVQHGTATVLLRVFDMRLSNSSSGVPEKQKENAKKIWNLIAEINKALHAQNFLQEGFGLPMRQQMRRTKRNDGCYQTELYYTVQFTDNSCAVVPERTEAVPIVTYKLKD